MKHWSADRIWAIDKFRWRWLLTAPTPRFASGVPGPSLAEWSLLYQFPGEEQTGWRRATDDLLFNG